MVASSALLTLGMAALSASAPLAARQSPTCVSGFYIIAARGTDEAPGVGKLSQVADGVTSQVADSAVVAVDYPASLDDYPSSVTDGINNAKQLVEDYVNACGGSSQIVLLGYSQGGNVMTDLLAGGVDKPAPLTSDYSQYITAVTVFGDPTFTVDQSFDQGTATKSGIFARGGSSLALLNEYASVIQDYCDDHDFFCASGDSLDVHYAEVPTNAQAAIDFIVAQYEG